MSENKWTPKPWRVVYNDKLGHYSIKQGSFSLVRTVNHLPENKANVDLMAASPEMAAKLEQIESLLDSATHARGVISPMAAKELRDDIRTILAKAKGEVLT